MKIKFEELISNQSDDYKTEDMRKQIVVNILRTLTNDNIKIITDDSEYKFAGTFDMSVNINGVELNPTELINQIVIGLTDNQVELRNHIHKFDSKHSPSAKLQKVSEQLGSVKTMLHNIESKLSQLK
jgi:hypothetical protein